MWKQRGIWAAIGALLGIILQVKTGLSSAVVAAGVEQVGCAAVGGCKTEQVEQVGGGS